MVKGTEQESRPRGKKKQTTHTIYLSFTDLAITEISCKLLALASLLTLGVGVSLGGLAPENPWRSPRTDTGKQAVSPHRPPSQGNSVYPFPRCCLMTEENLCLEPRLRIGRRFHSKTTSSFADSEH